MTIHLYNHRGDHIADTFEAKLEISPAVGDIIVRKHPGFPDRPITLWRVVGIEHNFLRTEPEAHVYAWETKKETVELRRRGEHESHLYEPKPA